MKNAKKWLCLLLAVSLVTVFAACGSPAAKPAAEAAGFLYLLFVGNHLDVDVTVLAGVELCDQVASVVISECDVIDRIQITSLVVDGEDQVLCSVISLCEIDIYIIALKTVDVERHDLVDGVVARFI